MIILASKISHHVLDKAIYGVPMKLFSSVQILIFFFPVLRFVPCFMLYDRKGLVENTFFVLLILGFHEVILLFITSNMDSQRKRVVCFFWSSCTKDIYVEQRRRVTSLV